MRISPSLLRPCLQTALLSSVVSAASAQISLTTAVDLALRNDPKIHMAEADLDRARATFAEVRDVYIPSAGATGGYGKSTGVPLSVPVVFSLASQSLLFNFSQKDNRRAATSGLQAANLALLETRAKVAEDAATTYLGLNNAQQRYAAVSVESGYAQRLVEIVGDRAQAGQDTRMDLLKARRTAAQIQLQQIHIQNEIAILADHLAHLIGISGVNGGQFTTDSASIPPLPATTGLGSLGFDSFGIQAAFASARSKQQTASGESRYRFRPQVTFGANYSRISTSQSNYATYYPAFGRNLSYNAASIGIQIQIPLFDKAQSDRSHGAAAEARKARFDAEDQRNQFIEGRFKLRQSETELAARTNLAEIDQQLAQEQIDSILAQLTVSAGNPDRPQLTPKDEQNARLQERAKYIELLDAKLQLDQIQISLLHQTGQLDDWLRLAAHTVSAPSSTITVEPALRHSGAKPDASAQNPGATRH